MNPNDHRSNAGLVQRYIGTAYDRLMILVDNMDALLELLEWFRNQQGAVDSRFEFVQATPATVWNVTAHNMNKKPSVSAEDTLGEDIIGEVTYTDLNNLIITFSAPIAGTAQLN